MANCCYAISPEGSPLRESEGRKAIVATTSWFQLARSAETLEPTVKTSGLIAYQSCFCWVPIGREAPLNKQLIRTTYLVLRDEIGFLRNY